MAEIEPWLNLALRWFHIICGIAWIGSSFYFIWLDNSLRPPEDKKDKKEGVGGEVWAVHGGGFYHKKKYQVAPSHMPEDLHWFKYEAYFTWLSGFLLLTLMYYFGADIYLIDAAKAKLTAFQATLLGLGFLAGGWLFYNALCKTPIGKNNVLFGLIWFGVIVASTWYLNTVFSGRGAFLHIGAMLGTVMAANVFFIIIPNQKIVVADLLAGRTPDAALGIAAKQRSTHNNYMTLPVLLTMVSSHYPMLYGNSFGWLILAGLFVVAHLIRHFFNLKHKGHVEYAWPISGVALFILIMFMAPWLNEMGKPKAAEGMQVSVAEVQALVETHCASCHGKKPTHVDFTEPPLGVVLATEADIRRYSARIRARAVDTTDMPMGNESGMTPEDRVKLGVGLDQMKGE